MSTSYHNKRPLFESQKKYSDFNTTIGNIDDTFVNSSNSYSTGSDYDYDVIDTGDSNSTMIDGNSITNSNGTSIDGNDGYKSTKHHMTNQVILMLSTMIFPMMASAILIIPIVQ